MAERHRKGHPSGALKILGLGCAPEPPPPPPPPSTHTEAMAEEPTAKPWGPATPVWVCEAIGTDARLRLAIDQCLSEQAHPDDMSMFPAATAILSRTSPEEIDTLVAQGRT
jgi:hypothetical protein